MRTLSLRTPSRRASLCPVWVGPGALDALGDHVAAAHASDLAVVVSDHRVAALHGEGVLLRLRARGLRAEILTFPAGETHKTRETKAGLEDGLAALGAGRDTVVVAVGGGVTGDLAGFLAATWHRGVPVYQVPTTLLAMADAALGGKTAVDVPAGKNLVGAFHQPEALAADPAVLATLPDVELRAGFAEVVKIACVADARFFARLEREAEALLSRDPEPLEDVVARCLALKHRVVAGDEREGGPRAALNFGHTVAHALEKASGWTIPHGEAVAVGCAIESALALEATGFPAEDRGRLLALLARFGLGTAWPPGVAVDVAVTATRADKKARGGRARYALPARIGGMPPSGWTVEVDEAVLRRALGEAARPRSV